MASSTPRTKNSTMINFVKNGDLEKRKKKTIPIVNMTTPGSRLFLERIVLMSKISEKDTKRATIK
jgi:hypothetical protein